MPQSWKAILEQMQQYQLLRTSEEKYLKQWQTTNLSPSKCLLKFVKDKKLTKYQARHLLDGRGARLRMGSYVILGPLGEGAMGRVLKARHNQMNRIVAIKTLTKQTAERQVNNKRFENEIRFVSQLIHPNIVQAYDAGIHNGVPFLVNEYIEGIDLQQLVSKSGPLAIPTALQYMSQAASALAYAHSHKIVHRDVKPANLMINNTGQIKLLDLGLARLTSPPDEDSVDQSLTEEHVIVGSCAFMAPELVKSPKAFSSSTDIYSLGCTLFYLLNGRIPYTGKTYMETFIAHSQSPIPKLCETETPVGSQLNVLFQKMVAKSPQQRLQNMAEVAAELKKLIQLNQDMDAPIPSNPNVAVPSLTTLLGNSTVDSQWTLTEEPVERWYERTEAKIFVAVIVVAAIVGGTFWYINPEKNQNAATKKVYTEGQSADMSAQHGGSVNPGTPQPPSGPVRQNKAVRSFKVGE